MSLKASLALKWMRENSSWVRLEILVSLTIGTLQNSCDPDPLKLEEISKDDDFCKMVCMKVTKIRFHEEYACKIEFCKT
ncbi:MAG: hypothetical protein ACPG6Z_07030 [Nitrosopumilus sp.]